jgi:hypothetical protein
MATSHLRFLAPVLQLALVSCMFAACGGDDDDTVGTGGKGGASSGGKSSGGSAGKATGGSAGNGTGGSAGNGTGGSGTGGSSAGEAGASGSGQSAGAGGSSAGEAGSGATSGSAGSGEAGSGGAGSGVSGACSTCLAAECPGEVTACELVNNCSNCLANGGNGCGNAPLFTALGECACSDCDGECASECADPNLWQ